MPETDTPTRRKLGRRLVGTPQRQSLLPDEIAEMPDAITELNDRAIDAIEAFEAAGVKARAAEAAAKAQPRLDEAADRDAQLAGHPLPEPQTPLKAREADVAQRVHQAARAAAIEAQFQVADEILNTDGLLADRRKVVLEAIESLRKIIGRAQLEDERLITELSVLDGITFLTTEGALPDYYQGQVRANRQVPALAKDCDLGDLLYLADKALLDVARKIGSDD